MHEPEVVVKLGRPSMPSESGAFPQLRRQPSQQDAVLSNEIIVSYQVDASVVIGCCSPTRPQSSHSLMSSIGAHTTFDHTSLIDIDQLDLPPHQCSDHAGRLASSNLM